MATVLLIEAFYGGSHKQLIDTIVEGIDSTKYELFTLPAKKWHWRARTSAIYFSQVIPFDHKYRVLFASSVLNLAELIGMRPDLAGCKKIVYFHENQLVYPVQEIKERDCQYGLNQIMTCLAADQVLFNSNFNRTSFLNNINRFMNIQSDWKIKNMEEKIGPKSEVLYFPIKFHQLPEMEMRSVESELHLVWPHRWEHDKNPELLRETLLELESRKIAFSVSIVGEQYQTVPPCFDEIRSKLANKIRNFGFLSRNDYLSCLKDADIVISTANHEFYGVSMLEAVYCGCMPLAPNNLVYPEIYPSENLYNTKKQLIKKLKNWCQNVILFQKHRKQFYDNFKFQKFSSDTLVPKYMECLTISIQKDFDGITLAKQQRTSE